MPRFYLHIHTPTGLIQDGEGSEYENYEQAIVEAIRGARCLMTGEVAGGTLCLEQSIEIHDAEGTHLTTVPFAEAVKLLHAPEDLPKGAIGDGGL